MFEDVLVRLEGGMGDDVNSESLSKPVFLKKLFVNLKHNDA